MTYVVLAMVAARVAIQDQYAHYAKVLVLQA